MNRWMLCAALWLASYPLARADAPDLGVWSAIVANPVLADPIRLWADAHARRDDGGFVGIARPGLGVDLSEAWSVWGGYAAVVGIPNGGDAALEHRTWQQVMGAASLGERYALLSRTRLEQRYSGSQVGHRIRQFIRVGGVVQSEGSYHLVAWNEVLIGLNATDWGAVAGFDQNRLFAGIATRTERTGRIEVGLMHVVRSRATLSHSFIASVMWFVPGRGR